MSLDLSQSIFEKMVGRAKLVGGRVPKRNLIFVFDQIVKKIYIPGVYTAHVIDSIKRHDMGYSVSLYTYEVTDPDDLALLNGLI